MNLLITGASGFIGKNLIKFILANNYTNKYSFYLITTKKDDFNNYNNSDLNIIETSNYNYDSLKNNTGLSSLYAVLHIGAFIPKSGNEFNDIEKSFSNINSTLSLIKHLPVLPRKFIFASTIDVYNNLNAAIDENTEIAPISLYGYSKLYCEKMLSEWACKNNVVLQIMRIGHIYGEGEEDYEKVIPVSIKALLNEENPIIFGKGKELRSFLYIKDLCRYIMQLLEINYPISPINLVSAQNISIKKLINKIIEVSGKKKKPIYTNSDNSTRNIYFNISKLDKYIHISETKLHDGLNNEYNYFKKIVM